MSETQNAAFEAAYKVAYEAAMEAAQAATGGYPSGYPSTPQTGDQDTLELSFRKIKNAVRDHWILIVAVILIFAILGFLYSQFLVTPKYQASVNMIVQTNNVETVDQSVSNEYVNSAKGLAKTYSRILNSSKVQNQVINELGLDMTSLELKQLAVAEPVTDSQIVKVTVITEDAALSKQIAEAYLRFGPDALNDLVEAGKCNPVSGVEVKKDAIRPGMKRTVALMGLVGLALSFAFALFREMQNHFVVTTEDVKEILDLPVLGVIPMASLA